MIRSFLEFTGWLLLRTLGHRQFLIGLLVCLILGAGTGALFTYRTLRTNRAQHLASTWHQVEESIRRLKEHERLVQDVLPDLRARISG